jgi:hypothetical protein
MPRELGSNCPFRLDGGRRMMRPGHSSGRVEQGDGMRTRSTASARADLTTTDPVVVPAA